MKERTNQCNHNLHLLQSSINTNCYGESKFTYFHIFVSLLNMDINRRQGRNAKVHLVFKFVFIIYVFH